MSKRLPEQDLKGHSSSKRKYGRAPKTLTQPVAKSFCIQLKACRAVGPDVDAYSYGTHKLIVPILED